MNEIDEARVLEWRRTSEKNFAAMLDWRLTPGTLGNFFDSSVRRESVSERGHVAESHLGNGNVHAQHSSGLRS